MTHLLAAAAFVATASFATTALADVSVTLSPGVEQALGGGDSAQLESEVAEDINETLKKMSKRKDVQLPEGLSDAQKKETRDAAKRLLDSKQTIEIMCREEAAKDPKLADLVKESEPGFMGAGGAATRGEFDAQGNPKKGGKTIIVIECAWLRAHGWTTEFGTPKKTTRVVLGHELLHASQKGYVHKPEDPNGDFYDAFGGIFNEIRLELDDKLERKRRKRAKDKKDKEKEDKEQTEKPNKGKKDKPPKEHGHHGGAEY